ncbi:hypothetical protein WN943_007103 [Citrus x changshan-huyou]
MLRDNILNCYLVVVEECVLESHFALQVKQFTLASLLQGFDFATPSNEPLDMGEGLGLTAEKYAPLVAHRSRSVTTTPIRSRSVTTTLVRSRTVTNYLPGYDSGLICT